MELSIEMITLILAILIIGIVPPILFRMYIKYLTNRDEINHARQVQLDKATLTHDYIKLLDSISVDTTDLRFKQFTDSNNPAKIHINRWAALVKDICEEIIVAIGQNGIFSNASLVNNEFYVRRIQNVVEVRLKNKIEEWTENYGGDYVPTEPY